MGRMLLLGATCAGLASSMGVWARPPVNGCATPTRHAGGITNVHTRHVETELLPAIVRVGTQPATLAERMRAYNVPGVSVAVIHHGQISWARGWGVRDVESCAPVTPDTVFQAASISKAVTAVLTLRLADRGVVSLDRDVNRELRTWRLPSDPKLAPTGVTLRQLLSHTAGLNLQGFPGYVPGAPLPTEAQILAGEPPASHEPLRSILPAGAQWQYSGGGYVLIQTILSDAARLPFAALAQREVLRPLGMKRSAFAQPPSPEILANAALGHVDGRIIPGGYHVYPELGPAGLWTTAGDLARFLIDQQEAVAGHTGRRLRPGTARMMVSPVMGDWGLGPSLSGKAQGRRFGHDGVNEGYQSTMVAYVVKGEGVVVLTNGDKGKRLADEIVRAVATDYGWKELASEQHVERPLSQDEIAALAGLYEGDGISVFLDARADGLFAQTGGPRPERLVSVGASRFRTDASGILIEFAPDYRSFRIIEGGPLLTLQRAAALDPARRDVPLYLRGSMNGWSTTAPFNHTSGNIWTIDLELAPGGYQFKVASDDWRAADYGTSDGEPVRPDGMPISLVPHGGNIRISVSEPMRLRFSWRSRADGKAELQVKTTRRR
ncbi:serine hydrolase [Sphingomonas sp. XXL09]|uniref:serine hydrolase n=1 Tax=Sphingomonas sp. XXL09 TaxID=3457787 RepID=UPI00406BC52F